MSEKMSPAEKLAKQLSGSDSEETVLSCAVKPLREKIGLSQSDVARSVGCSTATIGSIERGSAPRLDVALRLANFFEKGVSDLWSLPEATDKTPPPEAPKPPPAPK